MARVGVRVRVRVGFRVRVRVTVLTGYSRRECSQDFPLLREKPCIIQSIRILSAVLCIFLFCVCSGYVFNLVCTSARLSVSWSVSNPFREETRW